MKNIKEFLSYLRSQDIQIWAEGDRLRCSAPEGVLTPGLQAQLTERKAELLSFLREILPASGSVAQSIQPAPRKGNPPLSFAQERIWFLSQLEAQNVAYNMPFAIRLTGTLNLNALKQSFNAIIQRHEVLRTTFVTVDGQPVQVIAPTLELAVPVKELHHFSENDREAEVQRLALEEAQKPFDLTQGPLFRATLLHVREDEYVILAAFHHIVFDGWSTPIFIQELVTLYEAFSANKPSPLPSLPIQYADFAYWQRERLQSEVFAQQISYWKQQLSGPLPMLDFPTDYPRPPRLTFQGALHDFTLSQQLTKEIKTLCTQEGVTLFTTLLTAFLILLYRYTKQEDLVVGSAIANRNHLELENLIGFFVNTLAIRANLSKNPTVRELLRQIQAITLGAYEHQDIPFERLVAELRPHRELSRHPIFQVMFVLQNTPGRPLQLPGLTLTPIALHNHTAKFDITLEIEDADQELAGKWEYSTALFNQDTLVRMSTHFTTLLEGMVTNPAQYVSKLPLLTESERHQIVVEWNETTVAYPLHTCIHQLFEAQVEQTPDAVALIFEEQAMTYAELNRRANQLAHHLRSQGVGPEVLVGICIERSFEMVVGLLGILKAGGAYVPIDPEYPKERLAFMLEDSQTPVLITQEKLLAELPEQKTGMFCLDRDWQAIAQESAVNPDSGVVADNLIYVIYTSGSTGKPKGAMNIHRGLVNRLLWMQDAYQLTPEDRVLQKTPFSFDVSGWEFWWPLITGACLVIAKPGGHKDSTYLSDLIQSQRITTLHFVPSMLQIFLATPGIESCVSLRRVICSGEALPYELQERFFERLGTVELHNLYGPTEAAIDVTFWQCTRETQQKIVPIGRPIANTQIYILDQHLQPVPIGVPGELHIGGVNVKRGYLNRPELTREKFIPNPFGDDPTSRLYKTGDLARFLSDGSIEYLGRLDYQIKIRGLRVELGEIETTTLDYPGVREVVVLVREDAPGDKRLVAYIVAQKDQEPSFTTSELRTALLKKLPEYMVPALFITLESLPLTPNGKVDRRALPAPEGARPELETTYVRPRSETERRLAEIWQNVLQVEKVGIYDNFFELGGHSLLAMHVYSKIQEQYETELALLDLFQYPTVHALAQRLHPEQAEESAVESGQDRAKRRLVRQSSMKQSGQQRQRRRTAE